MVDEAWMVLWMRFDIVGAKWVDGVTLVLDRSEVEKEEALGIVRPRRGWSFGIVLHRDSRDARGKTVYRR